MKLNIYFESPTKSTAQFAPPHAAQPRRAEYADRHIVLNRGLGDSPTRG